VSPQRWQVEAARAYRATEAATVRAPAPRDWTLAQTWAEMSAQVGVAETLRRMEACASRLDQSAVEYEAAGWHGAARGASHAAGCLRGDCLSFANKHAETVW